MKKYYLFAFLLIAGCSAKYLTQYSFTLGVETSTFIGAPMIIINAGRTTPVLGENESKFLTNFRQELLYSGNDKNTIFIDYREYYVEGAAYARPSFYQNMKYDLSVSDKIRFRDIEIKVIKATNEEISFIVLKCPGAK